MLTNVHCWCAVVTITTSRFVWSFFSFVRLHRHRLSTQTNNMTFYHYAKCEILEIRYILTLAYFIHEQVNQRLLMVAKVKNNVDLINSAIEIRWLHVWCVSQRIEWLYAHILDVIYRHMNKQRNQCDSARSMM